MQEKTGHLGSYWHCCSMQLKDAEPIAFLFLFGSSSEYSKYQWEGKSVHVLAAASRCLGFGTVLIYGTVSCCFLWLRNSEFLSLLIFLSI